jgi:uncharacterized protein
MELRSALLFEWDERKNQANLVKHGIGFQTAALVFDDPQSLTLKDDTSRDEQRLITLGQLVPEQYCLSSM